MMFGKRQKRSGGSEWQMYEQAEVYLRIITDL